MIPDLSYSFYVSVLMIFCTFVVYSKQQVNNKLLAAPPFKWMYAFLVVFILMTFTAVYPERHGAAIEHFTKLIITTSLAYKLIDTEKKLDWAFWGYLFGSWYISYLAWQVGRDWSGRVEGIGTVDSPDSNGIAAAIAPALVVAFYYFWVSKTWLRRGLFAIAGIFIANGLILINSRGAFLGVAASLIMFMLYMFFSSTQRKYQRSIAIILTVLGLSASWYLMDDAFIERMQTIQSADLDEAAEKETGATRTFFWLAAIDVAKDHPLGSGAYGFQYFAPTYIPSDIAVSGVSKSVHSTWFEILTETGFLGITLYGLMLLSSLGAIRKCMATFKAKGDVENFYKMVMLQSALIAYLIAASFMDRSRAVVMFWLILFSACAYNIYILKNQKTAVSSLAANSPSTNSKLS
ncbi:putative O-glycosylation ligase, exosortase A-associated [Thiorhodovibrio winogradskyi]|uniref:O-glycosylation ligase, exosortase A-associated n=2 Tax=Thiorhodovibrio winogradskyi TaxID=77007 RepID=A0ABZ0S9T3_9GAMM